MAMSALFKARWDLHVGVSSTSLHHDMTHTLIFLKQIRRWYYTTEGDLDCLLLRRVEKSNERIDGEQELNDEKVPPLIDTINVFQKKTREHEQQILKAWKQCSTRNSEGDVSSLHAKEVSAQRMSEVRSAIVWEMEAVRISTINIPHRDIAHTFQLAQQRKSTRGANKSIEEAESAW